MYVVYIVKVVYIVGEKGAFEGVFVGIVLGVMEWVLGVYRYMNIY